MEVSVYLPIWINSYAISSQVLQNKILEKGVKIASTSSLSKIVSTKQWNRTNIFSKLCWTISLMIDK